MSSPVRLFGLEIPAFTEATRKMQDRDPSWEQAQFNALSNNGQLIRDMWSVVWQNGGQGRLGGSTSIGIIAEGDDVKNLKDFLIGVAFYATEEQARKIGAQFPTYRLIDAQTQQPLAPAPAAAQKPPAPKP